MSTDYLEPEDLSAVKAFLQVEQQADVIRALKQLCHTAGYEPLALVALRYGFGYNVDTLSLITGKSKSAVWHCLQHSLHTLACQLATEET